MSIAQISPHSILPNPPQTGPYSQNVQHAATAQATQAAQSSAAKSRSDTVTLSAQALRKNPKSRGLSDESRGPGSEQPVAGSRGKR